MSHNPYRAAPLLSAPTWADPSSKVAPPAGMRGVGDASNEPDIYLAHCDEIPRGARGEAKLESPLFRLRSILGAWKMRFFGGDAATRKLASANRKGVRRPILPPSHDITLHFRRAMPAILPIKGIG